MNPDPPDIDEPHDPDPVLLALFRRARAAYERWVHKPPREPEPRQARLPIPDERRPHAP